MINNLKQLKKEVFDFCLQFVDSRITRLNGQINDLQVALNSETKSSAGDKHETGRAMVQLEREKLGQQLAEAEKMTSVLHKIAIETKRNTVGVGSLVITSKHFYFIGISAGCYEQNAIKVFCISGATPIAQLLLGKSEKELICFNSVEQQILNIV